MPENATRTKALSMVARSRVFEVAAAIQFTMSRYGTRWCSIQKPLLLSRSRVTGPSLIE
jgi:hypothetical protein